MSHLGPSEQCQGDAHSPRSSQQQQQRYYNDLYNNNREGADSMNASSAAPLYARVAQPQTQQSRPPYAAPALHRLPHPTMLGAAAAQFTNSGAHMGMDVMWQQNPNPWMMAHYEDMRLERTRTQERERPKEDNREKHWEREERERVQREAVQQHFEESLRLALQKKNMGWNPSSSSGKQMTNKSQESSSTINMALNQTSRPTENDRQKEQDKERVSYMENSLARRDHERWLAIVQQQRNESTSAHLQNCSIEVRSSGNSVKPETQQLQSHRSSSKPHLTPSPGNTSAAQMKNEVNFSLYGYQPVRQTYITQAQLKAREEKISVNMQSTRSPSGSHKTGMPSKSEKDFIERPSSPNSSSAKHQSKVMLERSNTMYQPLVGSGGAFKPYEYSSNSNSPAPPAHQNTAPVVGRMATPHYTQVQDQPQNLVKSDGKEKLPNHKYENRDLKPSVSTTARFSPPFAASKSTSPAANATYSYSLIQQGLVPNPMYIASTLAGSNANAGTTPVTFAYSQPSKSVVHPSSPPVSQQYASPNSAISPICRPSSVPYTLPPSRVSRSYSPVGPPNSIPVLNSKDPNLSSRSHMSIQSSSHRSPSPAHVLGQQSNSGAPNSPHRSSPRMSNLSSQPHMSSMNTMPSSLYHPSTQPEVSGIPLVKRKLLDDVSSRKRPKTIDDTPPQLQPQTQTACHETSESQITPPDLVSNAPTLGDQNIESDSSKSSPASPLIPSNLIFKPEPSGTPPSMPDLVNSSPLSIMENSDSEHSIGAQNVYYKFKIPSKEKSNNSSEEMNLSANTPVPDSSEKMTVSNISELQEEQPIATNLNVTSSSINTSSSHPKLKKAWLQRHSENEDRKGPGETCSVAIKVTKSVAHMKPPEKPSIAHLKKTGESFLQDGSCCEVAPRLPKCRECRLTPHQRSKKMPNIFCRFYAYRKLRYGKNGTILSAGFSEPSDASDEDLKLWLPPSDSPPVEIEIETSKFLLTYLGDQFCDLVEMEREAKKLHLSIDETVTWKRVVQGVREMCDVCETTLFNIHWVCHKCGFVVCIDCYKLRKAGVPKEESTTKDRDDYQWLLCSNRQPHEQDKLMLTQIIAGSALWDVGKSLHDIRKKWNIPTYCSCGISISDLDGKSSSNGINKLMSAVTKCFSSDKDSSWDTASSDSHRSSKRSNKQSVNGLVKQEDGSYSSESGGSPLSWLADVALNSSTKTSDDQKDADEDRSEDQDSNADASMDSDDEKNENFSTLRELLIRPTAKMGGKTSGNASSSQKTLTSTLDEVISCVIEQKVRKSDKKVKEKQLLHFTRRYQMSKSGRELPPVRTCILAESSLLYPEIPHVWLGSGKILLLKDPYHSGNMQMFQEQWKRGQPVIIADVGTKLDSNLWCPESFLKEFGDSKSDFFNCIGGSLLSNQPLKKFWEGFENISKRIKDDDGESMVLKLVDWPPAEEFSEILPTRYDDLMNILPLPQYTHREGVLNMASRLPDCFVQPDLGPKMYNAYGISSSIGKGSTNLHLDISDSINILAYVSTPNGGKDDMQIDFSTCLDESGVDSLMKKRAKTLKAGALWHIYNARDADKIRDFLNKVSEEQGVKLNPHHDPIHNQEWYLDEKLRIRLYREYGVEPYTIVQCLGDAIFIPAGSPHQVLNLQSCVKVAEDFVSPESVGHSFFLTQEIRNLSDNMINSEDRLQIKNIIYHAVKDALALLQSHDPEDSKS